MKPVSTLLGECFKLNIKLISREKFCFPTRHADDEGTFAILRQHILIAMMQPMNTAQKTQFLQRIEQAIDGGASSVRTFCTHEHPRFFGAHGKYRPRKNLKQRLFGRRNPKTMRLQGSHPFVRLDGCGRHHNHLNDMKSHLSLY